MPLLPSASFLIFTKEFLLRLLRKMIEIEDRFIIYINSAAFSLNCFPRLLKVSLLFLNRLRKILVPEAISNEIQRDYSPIYTK